MRVAFIAPPWQNIYGHFKSAAALGCASPPMGLVYLCGAVESVGEGCRIFDMDAEGLSLEQLRAELEAYAPDIIGITATTPIYNNASMLASYLRKYFRDAVFVLGGVHATILPQQAIEGCKDIDLIVVGEGEETIIDLLRVRAGTMRLEDVCGIWYRLGEEIRENPPRPLTQHLDCKPLPARHHLHSENYQTIIPGRRGFTKYAGVFTSRGCPFECIFCSQHTMYGRKVRWHSIEHVLRDIEYIVHTQGIHHIIIMDETLTLDRERVFAFCQAVKERNLKFTFEGWTHVTTIDEPLLREMKSAGLIRLSFGIESGDEQIRKFIKKTGSLAQIREVYRLTAEKGIETRCSAIIGHPYETAETAWRTIRFIRSIKECKQAFLNVACPYPGTELYRCAREGIGGMKLMDEDFSNYTRYGKPVISVNDLSPEDLQRIQSLGLLYFYLTPSRICYNVFKRSGLISGIINALVFAKGVLGNLFFRTL